MSARQIARMLGIHRETVGRYIKAEAGSAKPATNLPAGSEGANCSKPANVPTGSAGDSGGVSASLSGPVSKCRPHHSLIEAKVEQGLTAQRIWQDLVEEVGFGGGYDSVKRYVRRLVGVRPLPFRRMECSPGAEVQVDFGTGAPVVDGEGKRRRTHVIRLVLSHSRKAYSESVFRQTTESFVQCLENAFWYFGGVPRTVVIDNLRAGVTRADWYDPELNPRLEAMATHYGTVVLPTKPYTPRHKGKVERGIGYVKSNALKGRTFVSLAEQNAHLLNWEASVADTRIHGTTRKQVGKVFAAIERPALGPLPAGRFPFFHEAQRSVHRDGHVEVAKAYYSIPPEYLGLRVWVRWDGRLVRIFNKRMEQIALHAQVEAGRFSTHAGDIDARKRSQVESGRDWLITRAQRIGPASHRWASAMVAERGIQGVRVLLGLLRLADKHPCDEIETACETALTHRAFRLRALRGLLKQTGAKQQAFEFASEHEIIRPLTAYGQVVAEQNDPPSCLPPSRPDAVPLLGEAHAESAGRKAASDVPSNCSIT